MGFSGFHLHEQPVPNRLTRRKITLNVRKQVEREGYVNSETAIPGSSPIAPSSSEFEVDMDNVDEDEHDARRSKPEEVTVHLITCFFQHALNLCLVQHPPGTTAEMEVWP